MLLPPCIFRNHFHFSYSNFFHPHFNVKVLNRRHSFLCHRKSAEIRSRNQSFYQRYFDIESLPSKIYQYNISVMSLHSQQMFLIQNQHYMREVKFEVFQGAFLFISIISTFQPPSRDSSCFLSNVTKYMLHHSQHWTYHKVNNCFRITIWVLAFKFYVWGSLAYARTRGLADGSWSYLLSR